MYNPSVNACGVATSLYTREAIKYIGRGGNLPPALHTHDVGGDAHIAPQAPHNLSKEYTTGKTLYAPEYSKVAKVLNLSPILVITPGI